MSIDEETDTLPPRCNMDSSKVDEHGQQLLSLCRSSGLHILNGRTIGDTLGMCTCYSYTGSPSVIDYMSASLDIRKKVEYLHVHDVSTMSIHCMLSTLIKTNMYYPDNSTSLLEPLGAKYKWKVHDDVKFQAAIASAQCQQLVTNFLSVMIQMSIQCQILKLYRQYLTSTKQLQRSLVSIEAAIGEINIEKNIRNGMTMTVPLCIDRLLSLVGTWGRILLMWHYWKNTGHIGKTTRSCWEGKKCNIGRIF